ncbi:14903_t:CDS:2 [Racocetra fulgida]|uniref:14903_t:CDS:1 n=1 Tax=Racocetra fulgida TaxID=60492 RepID=A0A9N8WNQ3_9GLOM|nr:14903_t:CDS:2 [Racocetra fulgida]
MNSIRNFHISDSTKPSLYPNIKNLNTESKRLILQILYPTLQTLLTKLPSLSVSIRDAKSSNPLFLQLDELYLTSLIKFVPISSESDLEKLIERQHDLKFSIDDETKPLWRIVVGITNLQKSSERPEYDFCILFCWHHTIVDEISSLSINNLFVETLNEIFKRYKSNTSTKLKKLPDSYTHAILPIQRSPQSCGLIEHAIDIVDVNSRNIHFHNKVKLVSLTIEEVRKLKMAAKEHVSKFNNRMGLWDLLSKDKILKQLINCQKKLVGDGKICSILYSNLDQFNSSLYPHDDILESPSTSAPSINFTPSSPDSDNNDSLVDVNLDDPDSNDSNGWKVIDMIFSQSMYLVGPALIVNSIFQGQKMNLCIVYRIGSVDEKSVDLFAEGLLVNVVKSI